LKDYQMDGTYGFVYSGAIGVGIGAFTIKNGVMRGSDGGNFNYRGTVSSDISGQLVIEFDMFVPAGVFLVQGNSPLEWDSTRSPPKITMPPEFGDGQPVTVDIPPGQVTLMVKRIPDDYAVFAAGFNISPISS